MPILTLTDLWAAAKQRRGYTRTAARTTVANGWFTLLDLAGNPGAGVLAGTNQTAGVVPTDADAGFPPIDTFAGGAIGYLQSVEFGNTVGCRIRLFDLLWKGGAYAFNAAQALSAQPSFLGRVPGGNALGCAGTTEIWAEQVTVATGNQAVNVTYTNEAGTTGRSTGAVGIGAAPTVGRCWQLPLQAGDRGVSRIDNVAGSVATAGTFNVLVLRPLWTGRVRVVNDGDVHDWFRTNGITVSDSSALYPLIAADGASSGVPDLAINIASG